MSEPIPFISRPMFNAEEAKDVLDGANRMVLNQVTHGQALFSPHEIMQYVATSLREIFFEIGHDHFEEVLVSAVG